MSLIKEKFDAVVKELNFDTSDPFTKMLAMAFAGIEAHDELKRAHADALERCAKLEKHAEAMAVQMTEQIDVQHKDAFPNSFWLAVVAYRADFPKEPRC